jgi:sporulation protein YlmC with PRC-barrel domain
MENVKVNSVVQINETGPEGWVGCLVQVSEVKSWGIQGWVQLPMQGSAYIRLNWENIDYIGQAILVHSENEEG